MGYLDNKGLERYTWNVRNRVAKNDQLTKTEQIVSFCPAPETELDPIVNFMFKETLPAEGEKGPENPSTIAGVSEIKLSRCGKNLFPLSKAPKYNDSQTINDVTFTMNEDGWITCNGTASARTSYFFIPSGLHVKIPAGTYTISGMPDASYGVTAGLNICTYSSLEPLVLIDNSTDTGNGKTFTLNEAGYIVVGIAISSGVKLENYVIKPQLEVGSKATSFEPYKGNDFSFSLNGTYYGGSVNFASGEMTVTWVKETVTSFAAVDAINSNTITLSSMASHVHPNNTSTSIVCNYFETRLGAQDIEHCRFASLTNGEKLYFYINKSRFDVSGAVDPSSPTTAEWKNAANAWLANHPIEVVFILTEPIVVQLDPIQVKSLASSDKYNHPVNYVYSNQESVQVGWIREDFIHKSGNETIEGIKTFSNATPGSTAGESVTDLTIRNPAVVRGIRGEGANWTRMIFADKEGNTEGNFAGRLGIFEIRSPKENDTTGEQFKFRCYKYSDNVSDYNKSSDIILGYDKDGIAYATAPSTSIDRSVATDIVTRDWLPKDTRIPQKSDLWNWQKTEKAGAVAFKPVPGSDLEPVVDFMFTETLPAEGEKSPENPSTISGVSNIAIGNTSKNIFWASTARSTNDFHGVSIQIDVDGTITLNGTCNTADGTSSSSQYLVGLGEKFYTHSSGNLFFSIIHLGGSFSLPSGVDCPTTQLQMTNMDSFENVIGYMWANEFGTDTSKTFQFLEKRTIGYPTLKLYGGVTYNNYKIRVQYEINEAVTDFEPASVIYNTIALGDTYYGGSLDVTTGVMTVTWEGISGNALSFYYGDITTLNNTAIFRATLPHTHYIKAVCNKFTYLGTSSDNTDSEHFRLYGPAGTTASIQFWINKSRFPELSPSDDNVSWRVAATNWIKNNNVIIVYELGEPFTIQLTPTQIRSLQALDKYEPRINTVYTDQEAVQVGYQRYTSDNGVKIINQLETLDSSSNTHIVSSGLFIKPDFSKTDALPSEDKFASITFIDKNATIPLYRDSTQIRFAAVDYAVRTSGDADIKFVLNLPKIQTNEATSGTSMGIKYEKSTDAFHTWFPPLRKLEIDNFIAGNHDYSFINNKTIDISQSAPETATVNNIIICRDSKNHWFSTLQNGFFANGDVTTFLTARNYVDNELKAAQFTISIDKSGKSWCNAPSTLDTRTNGTDVLTRDWIPKDTRIVHTTSDEIISGQKQFNENLIQRHATFVKGSTDNTPAYFNVRFVDKNGHLVKNRLGLLETSIGTTGNVTTRMAAYKNAADSDVNGYISITCAADGTLTTYAPTPSTSDSSGQIATTSWVNTANSVVHKTGNETINGIKAFTSSVVIRNSTFDMGDTITSSKDMNLVFRGTSDNSFGIIATTVDTNNDVSLRFYVHQNKLTSATTKQIYFKLNTDGTAAFFPSATNTTLGLNNSYNKWGQIYSTSATISTSDLRLKSTPEAVPNDILDAWSEVDFVQFKMLDSINEKGFDNARFHNGLIAQNIDNIFKKYNLDASKYGLFCYDKWDAEKEVVGENGIIEKPALEAGDCYSLRYEEALCMEAAYMRRENMRLKKRIADLEERLAAIESRFA